ncbi:MAG: 4-alpha-glucanotransferase [Acidobacteriaceae bacterium]
MPFPRSSGLLLHPTSLPGPYGIGDLGPEAYRFADFLHAAGQTIWQVLPLNPTGYADSPYQCFSAFAGNPLLLSLDRLLEQGLLCPSDIGTIPDFPADEVVYGRVIDWKYPILRTAARNFFSTPSPELHAQYDEFCAANASWLDDFALFMAVKEAHGLVMWTLWDRSIAQREPEAMKRWRDRCGISIREHKFWQFEFFRQWSALQQYCHERNIRIMGDIPIYVAHDSADVWARPDLFHLKPDGNPALISGVPPDYFSATGQLWGNPIYRWNLMKANGYQWWIERFRAALGLFDMMRVDHFRGFEAYWEIPGGDKTAQNGRWVKGPGAELFDFVTAALGPLPIVAENLGVITPEVEAIRHRFGYPGMALLQFGYGTDPQGPSFRPHNYVRDLVAYTGGHDNDTMVGWWTSGVADSTRTEDDLRREHEFVAQYFGFSLDDPKVEINWVFIRVLYMSVAATVLVPVQDVIGLDSRARMNVPGRPWGNWKWRLVEGQLTSQHQARLEEFTRVYDR